MNNKKANYFKLFLVCLAGVFLLLNNSLAAETKEINGKTFTNIDGCWVDEDYNEDEDCLEVFYGSSAYYALKDRDEKIKDFLSLGKNVKVNIDNQNIYIKDADLEIAVEKIELKQSNDFYVWAIIVILIIFFVAALIIVIISIIHKNEREKD